LAIFSFAVVIVASMWIYLDRHTAPFRPLRRALATEFEDSAPKVEGGQRKMHQGTPVTLRIVMRVTFNPNEDAAQAKQFATRVYDFSSKHHDMTKYDIVEIDFYYLDPEQKIEEWGIEIKPNEVSTP